MGFLFGWTQLVVILSSSIAAMAYAFGDYAVRVVGCSQEGALPLAAGAVLAVSALNMGGLRAGKFVQNLLSVCKVVGLLAIVVAGLWAWAEQPPAEAPTSQGASHLGLALVFILYAYGGWNDAAFVAAEVRHPRAIWRWRC